MLLLQMHAQYNEMKKKQNQKMPSSTILHYTDSVCANVYQMSSVTEDLLQSKAEFLPAKESLELNVILKYGSPISFSS